MNEVLPVVRIIDGKGRILLPAELLKQLGWNPGDKLYFIPGENEVVLKRR